MKLRAALAPACAALVMAACTPGAAGAPGASGPEPRTWDRSAAPEEVATWALSGCGGVLKTSATCVERALKSVIEPAGVGKAMAALNVMVERDATIRREAHGLAHSLGIAAYRSPETVGATFAECPPTQMSGCYHGVIQGYFLAQRETGVDAAKLNALCEEQRGRSQFLFFQCAHGVGHGLMALNAHHVPRSLAGCDVAKDPFVRESCYGGVFMENIVAVTHPHHTAEAHAEVPAQGEGGAHDAHAGHGASQAADPHAGHGAAQAADPHAGVDHGAMGHAGHGQQAAAEPWKPLDKDDPLYPCNVVAPKYQMACYTNQTSAILWMNGGSVAATARACEEAPAGILRRTCFESLGRDITALAAQDHGRSRSFCAIAEGEGEAACIGGVSQNLVNLAADPAEGMRFCRGVQGEANQRACYEGVGRMLFGLAPEPARREEICATADPSFVAVCRAGAGLPPRPAQSTGS
ncbi:MAG TPA: hypothetical protein VHG91_06105 [Longimicrobium sp.]|nr:hypothetical protein [Longimicrobium sp.]